MLVDHANPASDRVRGPSDLDGLAIEQNLPFVRARQSVEDVHERRLAGAVLSEQSVDFAAPHFEIDVIVGDDAGIALGDAAHLERGDGRRLSSHDCLTGAVA